MFRACIFYIFQLLWNGFCFENSHFYSLKITGSLIDFPCPKQRINCWILLNGNIYGVSVFTKSRFQKTSPKEKLEWAIKGKQVPSMVFIWVSMLNDTEATD